MDSLHISGGLTAHRKRMAVVVSVVLVVTAGLLISARSRSPRAVPKSPPDAVQVVVKGLAENRPEVLWKALPPSYQADVRGVIATFCDNMDPALYDRMFQVMNKAVRVLSEKEQYFAKSGVALSIPMLESSIGSYWRHDVGLMRALATSDLSSMARLRQMDPGAFLESTGHELMAGMEDLRLRTQHAPGLNPWEKLNHGLKQGQIEFVRTTNGQGYLRFSGPTNYISKDVAMVEVEGRWVPAEMEASWKSRVARAKEDMAKLNGPEFAKAKPILNLALNLLDASLDSLLKAGNQKEFDEKLKGMAAIGSLLQSLKPPQK